MKIKLLFVLLSIEASFLYAPPKKNPKGKVAKSSTKEKTRSKGVDPDDELLDAILDNPDHLTALGEAKKLKQDIEEQKRQQLFSRKFQNLTPTQQKKSIELFKLLDGDFSVEGHSQKVFDFIMTIQDPAIINVQNVDGMTALMVFSELGNLDVVTLLLEKKADPNIRDTSNWTALMYAAEMSNQDIVALLLEQKNININQQNDEDDATALIIAIGTRALVEATNIARMLLLHGANPNIPDSFNMTALMFAAQEGYFDVVKLLIDYKAKLNEQNNDAKTALMIAANDNHSGIVKLLLSQNADSLIQDKEHWTALMYAAQRNNKETVQMILNHEAKNNDTEAVNINKLNALIVASRLGFLEIVQILLRNGMPIKILKNGENPLFVAAQYGHQKIVDVLLTDGFPVNIQGSHKATPLMVAAYNNRLDIINKLLLAGADPSLKDYQGKTALMIAKEQGHKESVNLLNAVMLKQKNEEIELRNSYKTWQENHFEHIRNAHIAKQDAIRQSLELEEELQRENMQPVIDNELLLPPSPVSDWAEDWDQENFVRIQNELND